MSIILWQKHTVSNIMNFLVEEQIKSIEEDLRSIEEHVDKRCKPNGLFCPIKGRRTIANAESKS